MAASEHVNQHRLVPASRAPARLRPSSDGGARFTSTEYISMIATDADTYEGPYEAVPSWEQQTFGTASRIMSQDFAVDSIIKLEVPNDAGGLTLTI